VTGQFRRATILHPHAWMGRQLITVVLIVRFASRKASSALADPWPAKRILPKVSQLTDCGDYEAELAVIIGKTAKNVSEADAMDYVLGYTAANDVSSRTPQFAQSQWCYSKGFDGSCPLGQSLDCLPEPQQRRFFSVNM
jgi:2-keto-4-pentenoate hydratase/2-oxohepta-3-ene-1,7-dioic acid hydratase in catechol pathway